MTDQRPQELVCQQIDVSQDVDMGGWVTHPQCRKVLLQGQVGLESHGLAARTRLASTENVFIGL